MDATDGRHEAAVKQFSGLSVDSGPSTPEHERPPSTQSSSTNNSHSNNSPQVSRPPLLLRNSSAGASSTSSFSRKSSIHSTDSVAAVPVKTPARTPVATPGLSRGPSSLQQQTQATLSSSPGQPSNVNTSPSLIDSSRTQPPSPSPPPAEQQQPPSEAHNAADVSASSSQTATPNVNVASAAKHMRPDISTVQSGRLPSHISSDPPQSFHMPMPSNASSNGSMSTATSSLPPTPSGVGMMRANRPGIEGRAPSSQASSNAGPRRTAGAFEFGPVLGEGSYSTVYKVTDRQVPSKQYALKVLDKRHIVKEKKQKYVTVEKDTLYRLDRHPGIVRLHWTFHDERSLYFVLELAGNGELLKCIKKSGSFSIDSTVYYAAQILSTVEHMHKRGVIHRDLKPENILLDNNMRVKITDFGTAKIVENDDERANSFVGTAEYVSPELLTNKTACKASDFWALGCIIFQMLAGKPPFKAPNEYLTFQKIINLEYTFPPDFPPQARDLIEKLLVRDPAARFGAETDGIEHIKAHPFFETIDWSTLWSMPAPVISSGLVSPPPETDEAALKGAMDDYFSFAPIASSVTREEDEERGADDEKQTQTAQPANAARSGVHAQPLESIDSSGSSANGVVGQARREAIMGDSPDNKWSRILLPREQVILSGPVMSRHGLFNKKRYLILTDYPRLLVVREAKTRIKIKHEILIGVEAGPKSPSAGPAGHHHHHHTHGVDAHKGDQKGKHKDHDVQALQVLNAVVEDGQKAFKVITNLRTLKLEDTSGSISNSVWIARLRQSHQNGVIRSNAELPRIFDSPSSAAQAQASVQKQPNQQSPLRVHRSKA